MSLSTTSAFYPTGNVVYAQFTGTVSNVAITAGTNITALFIQNPSTGVPLFFNVSTETGSTISAITAPGQTTNGVCSVPATGIIVNVGKANSAYTTVYVTGITAGGTSNVYITPMA